MSRSKYLRLYKLMCPMVDDDWLELDADAIKKEMRGMIRAKTNAEAVKALGQWWTFSSNQRAIAFVVKARRIWEKMK